MTGVGLGREAETLAAGLLTRAGFSVVAMNVRTAGGELDLVARDGDVLVFVEVKARTSLACGRPEEFVDRRKRDRLAAAAGAYLSGLPQPAPGCRFDVVAVDFSGPEPSLRHLRDAFRPGE